MARRDKGTCHTQSGTESDGVSFHHVAQNGTQFKTRFIPGIFHAIFLNCS